MPTTVTKVTPTSYKLRAHRNVSGSISGPKTAPPVYKAPPDPPVYAQGSHAFVTQSITSQSTPNWALPKPRYVSFPKKRKPFRMKSPVPPVKRQLRRPAPPIQRRGSSDKSFNRALRKYGARLKAWQYKSSLVDFQYSVALERYNAAKARYDAALLRYNSSPLGLSKKRAVGKVVYSVNNPMSKSFIVDTGWEYWFRYRQYCFANSAGSDFWYRTPGPGPYVSSETAIYGMVPSSMDFWFSEPHPTLPGKLSAVDHTSVAIHKAINKFYEELADQQVHIGNMIAERAQTIEMLGSSISRLKDFLHSPKKTVLKFITSGAGNITKKISDDFLQYCFGVEPLVSDVYAIAQKLSKINSDIANSDMIKVRAGGSSEETYTYRTDLGANYVDVFNVTIEVRVRYMCEYRINNSALRSLNSYGLVNPLEIAWETLPWSFVIDWFLPIGNFIKSLTADQGLSFKTGTYSIYTSHTRTVQRKYRPYAPFQAEGKEYVGEINRALTETNKNRTVLTAPPVSRLPRFKSPLSLRHFALSLALWRQRI